MPKSTDFDYTKIKIKQEKLSPPRKKEPEEIIDEIIPTLFNSNTKKETGKETDEIDNKKNVEPVKSSNEILAELFKVFNAAPPKSLLSDEFLLNKKAKKKRKKEKKHKKKSKKKGRSSSDESSDSENITPKEDKHKKKKRKKSKHSENSKKIKLEIKEEKDKEKKLTPKKLNDNRNSSDDSDFSISDYEENELPKSPIAPKVKIKVEKDDNHYKKNSKDKSSSYNFSKEITSKNLSTTKNKDKPEKDRSKRKYSDIERHIESEISLSDEETYLKEKEKYNDFYKNRDLENDKQTDIKKEKIKSREDNEFYRGSRLNSRDRDRERDRDRDRDRDRRSYRSSSRNRYARSRWRSRSRSLRRSTSRSRELGIDKKRLLEIARKNAISMFKKGALPGTQQMSQDIKDKVLMKMRYGGKTVEDLTDFCKKLSNGENLNEISDLSNDDSDHDKDGNEKAFVHHPFVIKDRAPIVMNIKNSVPIQPKSAEETKALLMQFPVSSGQQHRLNESEWVPVPKAKTEPSKPTPPVGTIIPTASKRMIQQQLSAQIPKTVFGKPLPADQKQLPAFVPANTSVPTTENDVNKTEQNGSITNEAEPPPVVPIVTQTTAAPVPVPPVTTQSSLSTPIAVPPPVVQNINTQYPPPPPPPQPPLQLTKESIFPQQPHQNLDVASIIGKRLNAMRRLQENPMDAEALKIMYTAQKDMSTWASMKQVPGQFTGSTGVNVLSARELSGGVQAWAKRDQLTSTTPVSGGMGMHLLQKMGWKPGEGLGRERNGALQPLLLEVKLDKRGVMAIEEDPTKKRMREQYQKKPKRIQHGSGISQAKEALETKHPVSLLGEIASKKRWTPPFYELVDDKGPSHNKAFIFKVVVNDIVYQPTLTSTTKKAAKAVAAKYCLQQLGVLSTTAIITSTTAMTGTAIPA